MLPNSTIQGYPPSVTTGSGNPEAEKYGRLWETEAYRSVAPGEAFAQVFLAQASPRLGAHVIDFGCGTGRGALRLHEAGMRVTMLDFARNCLDENVRERLCDTLSFRKHDLSEPSPVVAEYGFCTDVLEHIPPAQLARVVDNLLRSVQYVFLAIATEPDRCGALIGEALHLSVHPTQWWREALEAAGCTILQTAELPGYALFYGSAWQSGQVVVESGEVNTSVEQLRRNVEHNCAQGWQQVYPHEATEQEVVILGGGPSLGAFEQEIRELKAAGAKIVTLNGAYSWALERGLGPVTQIMVDARPFNARFVQPVREDCMYLIGSQCDPSVFAGLPKERTWIWHATANPISDLLDQAYPSGWWPVPGGSTVLLRALPLLRMLGFSRFHLFGCDSCLSGDQHHAFAQPENDGEAIVPIVVTGGRVFYCYPWMVSQAQEFIGLVRDLGDVLDLCFYGDGLLAHIVEVGANLSLEGVERS